MIIKGRKSSDVSHAIVRRKKKKKESLKLHFYVRNTSIDMFRVSWKQGSHASFLKAE